MLRDGRICLRGERHGSCAASTDDYLQTFLSVTIRKG